ncbi:Imm51 family immunity protein [Hymenobacter negativus]|uniref:Uncharacterized protein n=1 Tax=Hymenobacter negativus TaxID=2795026 RepID=A0ABS3QA35_9BACT|nr:Imm51 family immunity protein [Hymenobacter negativus]MBO2008087.1 hypothetical protein [Hymenobacter negativus]
MEQTAFKEAIKPFFWSEHDATASLCLEVGSYRTDLFATRADEGFEGTGYDWASLADVFLAEQPAAMQQAIRFDPEGSMFCAYSADKPALQRFALDFKAACDDEERAQALFARAELD